MLARVGDDVGQAFEVDRQQAVILAMVDQRGRAGDEARPVGEKREHHADRHLVGDNRRRRQIDGEQQLEPEHEVLDQPCDDPVALLAIIGRDDRRVAVAPAILAHRLVDVELDRADRADAFHEERLFIGARDDLLLGAAAQCRVHCQPEQDVDDRDRNHEQGQLDAEQRHHHERGQRQHRVDDGVDDAGGEQRLNRLGRTDPRHQIADMARFEIAHRQPQQVTDDIAAELERDRLTERQHHPGTQTLDDPVQDVDQAESDQQQAKQVGVALPDRFVDGELHEERHRQRGELEQQ